MTDLVPSGNRTTTFTHDALGNLRHLAMTSFWNTYNYGPDFRLTGVSYPEFWGLVGDHMQYNAQGEVTQTYTATSGGGEVGVQNIAYSAGHRLLAYGTDWTYAYDAAGRRVKARQAGGTTTYYAYGQGGHLLLAWQSGTHTDYVYLGNRLVAKDVDGTTTLLVTDVQGSLVATVATDGTVLGTLAYHPYGGQAPATFYPQRGVAYTGHYLDATNLLYMQQRYYSAGMKRFLSPDPVAPVPGNIFNFNRYAYANDNPVVNIDPDGLCAGDGEVSAKVQAMRDTADGCNGAMAEHAAAPSFSVIDPSHMATTVILRAIVIIKFRKGVDGTTQASVMHKLNASADIINQHSAKLTFYQKAKIRKIENLVIMAKGKTGIYWKTGTLAFTSGYILNLNSNPVWLATQIAHDGYHVFQLRDLGEVYDRSTAHTLETEANNFGIEVGKIFGLTPYQINYILSDKHTAYNDVH